ncbi:hypothetical protein LTR10_014456 [Elasticomyces elasticus]|uniref:Uncharacterized protein n=1 Tax=Exophiala sideris TaxID=1016849 RepID=A0ABR0J095_9EURO|nr:hypothetical protein LTR10_014456 [Elasticomyces elasticus]KAK5023630.1 hypothetical protein LTS07_009138 [Exophiala sideris]KAK5029630.1 hypothetical protein LTR13_008550 [Exophiala sideris]KAK5053419.1 hypothetical protein LTR69_009377 [Exophiala sideris]KAK5179177.1 hypothetical protein LTR44_008331 [Eurotiomycetes sp. CCFEE 6388]
MTNPSYMVLLFVFLFWSCLADAQSQQPLGATDASDPSSTDSIKSIFSSFSGQGSLSYTLASPTGCCESTCALGFCNGFTIPGPIATGSPSQTTAAPAPGITDHRGPHPSGRSIPVPDVCSGRPSSINPCACGGCGFKTTTLMSTYPAHHTGAGILASASSIVSPKASESDYNLVQVFNTNDFSGSNHDTLPIIVQDGTQNPVSLIADIDLDVLDNYISTALVEQLGLSSLTATLPTPQQQEVSLGEANNTPTVTPHAKITLNFLAGQAAALKKFAGVEFSVFDLPTVAKGTPDQWEPELFLGVRFLRAVGALGLTAEFAGNGVVDGVPVLVRDMSFVDDQGRDIDVDGHVIVQKVIKDIKDEL